MSQALSSQRSWIARIAVLAMVASLMAFGAAPAGAAIDTSDSCPASIPDAGLTDLGGVPAAAVDAINCIVDYGISTGTTATTFDPFADVERWQMALFLTRQAEIHGVTLPDGSDQGFVDVLVGLPSAAVTAINQTAQLGISTGTTATTFDPFAAVERWQMALFLTRLITAAGITLPDGSDQGFTDLAGVPAAAVTAINQLAQLDVSDGTTATTFAPFAAVERWAMALFLTRVLAADGIVPATETVKIAAPQLVSAARNSSDATVVTFTFDEAIPGKALVPPFDGFRLYSSTGTFANPTDATISGSTVVARFTSAQVTTAARAGVRYGAVEDATGLPNVEGDAPLTPAAVTTAAFPAQLKSVDNYRLSTTLIGGAQRILVDFTFDDDIADPAGTNAHDLPGIGGGSAGIFWLLGSNGQLYNSLEVVSSSVDTTNDDVTVTIAMQASDPTEIPQSQLRRGIVFVTPVAGAGDGQWLTNPWATQNGNTVDPDLVSVERTSTTSYRFTFDEAVDDGALAAGNYIVADAAGNNTAATAVARSAIAADGAAVVIATFPSLPQTGAGTPAIGITDFGAATATDSTASGNLGQSVFDEEVLTVPAPVQLTPGVTDLADLVSVSVSQDIVTGNYTASFEFDEAVNTIANPIDFDLFDADGIRFRVVLTPNALPAYATLSNTSKTVNITIGGGSYTNEQMAAAVVGAVQNAGAGLADVTEGEASVD